MDANTNQAKSVDRRAKSSFLYIIKNSVARRFAIALISLSFIAYTLLTLLQFYFDYQNKLELLNLKIHEVGITHEATLSASVWNYSEKHINIELRGIIDIPGFEYAEVKSVKGEAWAAGEKRSSTVFINEVPLRYSNNGREEILGTLTISAGKPDIVSELTSLAPKYFIPLGGWALVFTISLFYMFHRLVARHLIDLANYTSTISIEPNTPPLVLKRPISGPNSADELDKVVSSINSMKSQLAGSILELTRSEHRFRTAFENLTTGNILIDASGVIQSFNKEAENIFQYPAEEIIGQNVKVLMPEPYKSEHDRYLSNYRNTAVTKIIGKGREVSGLRKNGEEFPMHLGVGEMALTDSILFIGSVTDLTELKSLQQQLTQAHRMEAIGQLTGGIAHDFNNLLGIMIGNVEFMEEKIGENKLVERPLNAVKEAVDRGASLTSRLLAFSRQQTLLPVATNLTNQIAGLQDMLQRALGETVDLRVCPNEEIWPATIDPHQFENALLNLAINARDAMPSGGMLTISTSNETVDDNHSNNSHEITLGDYVKVAVSDTGTGMPTETLEKVFEPFFTTKEVGHGSGLGLSMVYGFAKQSKGHVEIYSEVGHGTTVTLYMPRSIRAGELSGPNNPEASIVGGLERILVIEDDKNLREVPVNLLSEEGYQIVEVGNGPDAIKLFDDGQKFDLLFTDVVLPLGMNGVEVAEKVKKIQPDIKVLYTTGYAEHAIKQNVEILSDINIVNKPYGRVTLLQKVRAVLDS
jgi:PAS domain S-box-containing protein